MLVRNLAAMIAACSLIAVPGCKKEKETPGTSTTPKVAYVTNGVASFWVIAKAGAEQGGEDFDATVSVHMPAEGITEQKRMVEDLLTRGVDGIAISPIDPANQTDLINQAAERTHVITHDSDAPASNRRCYIGMDNYAAGWMCGELVKEALPEGGEIMIFIGRLEQDNARRRRQGVIDAVLGRPYDPENYDPPAGRLEGGGFTVLGTLTDQFDRAQGKANAEDSISKYPELDAMVGLFAYNPPLCLEALTQAGRLNDIKVIAFDEADETLEGITNGTVYGTVVQDPYMYGYKSVEILAAMARGDESMIPDDGFIDIPARAIKQDNVAEFWADLKEKTGG